MREKERKGEKLSCRKQMIVKEEERENGEIYLKRKKGRKKEKESERQGER